MALDPRRSIRTPIVIASLAVLITFALAVGWITVIGQNASLTERVAPNTWLLATGLIAFMTIISVIVLFTIYQVREIMESRRQSRFIDSVTHELKSPLASLKLCVETLSRRQLDREQRDRLHQMMLGDIDRLSAFIDDIIESSRITHGIGGQTVARVNLAELAAGSAERVVRRYRLDAADLVVDVPADLELVCDPTALDTVLKNLLDNAVKYSDPPPRVRLVAESRGQERVHISVRDHGIGIPRSELPHVFDRFYRVDREEVRTRKGTGLGLYVVNALVRTMGGRLEATSHGKGQGTTMSFELPIRPRRVVFGGDGVELRDALLDVEPQTAEAPRGGGRTA